MPFPGTFWGLMGPELHGIEEKKGFLWKDLRNREKMRQESMARLRQPFNEPLRQSENHDRPFICRNALVLSHFGHLQ